MYHIKESLGLIPTPNGQVGHVNDGSSTKHIRNRYQRFSWMPD